MKPLPKVVGCPVELSLAVLGGKWKPVILARLKERPHRYGELRRLIPSLSDKMLTERLRDLEEQGLVHHETDPTDARQQIYRLSTRGESLRPILQALYDWGEVVARDLAIVVRAD